jgi:hypothetical protein
MKSVGFEIWKVPLVGYNAVLHAGNKQSCLFHAGFLLDLFFDPEDGGDVFVRSIDLLSAHYTALYPRI